MNIATSEDLSKINQFTRKELTAEDVYVFNVNLCNNDVDRDFEKFSLSTLNKLAELFVGKTGISDHSFKSSDQKCRIFETEVVAEAGKFTKDGEQFYNLKAKAYMLNNKDNKAFIDEIEAGIKKEVSISCSTASRICSICGSDQRKTYCDHRLGNIYNDNLCFGILDNPTDAYEFSFVAVPAQREAGVTKSFKNLQNKLNEGREYRNAEGDLYKWAINKSEDGKILFDGYACVFNQPYLLAQIDDYDIYEIVKDYAFNSCDMSDVIMQYNHEGRVFARNKNSTLKLSVDEYGLKVKADLSQTQLAREIAEEIEKGFSDLMAYGCVVEKAEEIFEQTATGRKKLTRIVHSVGKLYDVSVASKSANDATDDSMRSRFKGVIEKREQELFKQEQIRKEQIKAENELKARFLQE